MDSRFLLSAAISLLLVACKKHQAADPYDVMNNTAAQNAVLLEGNWIEDSLEVVDDKVYATSPGSFLLIDSTMKYSFLQVLQGFPDSISEGGTITFQGHFFISFNLGPNHYDPLRGLFQISVANMHKLVLYGGVDSSKSYIPIFYYHK